MEVNLNIIPKAVKYVFGINWKTTVGGMGPGFAAAGLVATAIGRGEWPSATDLAIIVAGLGALWTAIFAKDKNVTGGSVSNATGAVAPITVSLVDMTPGTEPKK